MIPNNLPSVEFLENEEISKLIVARSALLLSLVKQKSFAYDIENEGKITRFVGNFKGGGINKIKEHEIYDKSSHSGLKLDAHTEGPYYSSRYSLKKHSPAPNSLILSARWNPEDEPTHIIPMVDILHHMESKLVLALTTNNFKFTHSDSYEKHQNLKNEEENITSIINIDDDGSFYIRFNAYRFKPIKKAPDIVVSAYNELLKQLEIYEPIKINLDTQNVLLINNNNTVHCRDIILNNRRLLIRLFGYDNSSRPIVIRKNPLLVIG